MTTTTRRDFAGLRKTLTENCSDTLPTTMAKQTQNGGEESLLPNDWWISEPVKRVMVFKGAVISQTELTEEVKEEAISDMMKQRLKIESDVNIKISASTDVEGELQVFESYGYCEKLPLMGLGPAYHNKVGVNLFSHKKRDVAIGQIIHPYAAPKSLRYLEWGEYSALEGRDIDEKKLQQIEKTKTQNVLHYLRTIKEAISTGDNHVTFLYNWMLSVYHLKLVDDVGGVSSYSPDNVINYIAASKFPVENPLEVQGLSYQGKLMRYLPTLRGENYQAITSFPDATIAQRKELLVMPTQLSTEQYAHLLYAISSTSAKVTRGGETIQGMSQFEAAKADLSKEITVVLHELDSDLTVKRVTDGTPTHYLSWQVLASMLEKYVAFYGLTQQLAEAKALVIESLIDSKTPVRLPIMQHACDWAIRMNTYAGQTSGRMVCMASENVIDICYLTQSIWKKMQHVLVDRLVGGLNSQGLTMHDTEGVKIFQQRVALVKDNSKDKSKIAAKVLLGYNSTIPSTRKNFELTDLFDFTALNQKAYKHIKLNSFLMLSQTPRVAELATAMKKDAIKKWETKTLTDSEYVVARALFSSPITITASGEIATKHWADATMNIDVGNILQDAGGRRSINQLQLCDVKERSISSYTHDLKTLYIGLEGETVEEVKAKIVLQRRDLTVAEQILELPVTQLRSKLSISNKFQIMRTRKIETAKAQNALFEAERQNFSQQTIKPPTEELTSGYNNDVEHQPTEIAIDGAAILAESQNGGRFLSVSTIVNEKITICTICGDQEPNPRQFNPKGHECDKAGPFIEPERKPDTTDNTYVGFVRKIQSFRSAVKKNGDITIKPDMCTDIFFKDNPVFENVVVETGIIENSVCLNPADAIRFDTATQGLGYALCLWDDYGPKRGFKKNDYENANTLGGNPIERIMYLLLERGYQPILLKRERKRWVHYYRNDDKGPPVYLEMNNSLNLLYMFDSNVQYLSDPGEFFSIFGCRSRLKPTIYNVCCTDPSKEVSRDFLNPKTCVDKIHYCPPHMIFDTTIHACVDPTKKQGLGWKFWVPVTFLTTMSSIVLISGLRWYILKRRGQRGPGPELTGALLAGWNAQTQANFYASVPENYDADMVSESAFTVGGDSNPDPLGTEYIPHAGEL